MPEVLEKVKKKKTGIKKPDWYKGSCRYVWTCIVTVMSEIKMSTPGKPFVVIDGVRWYVDDKKGRWNRFIDKGPFLIALSVRRLRGTIGIVHHFKLLPQRPRVAVPGNPPSQPVFRVLGKVSAIFPEGCIEVRVFRNQKKSQLREDFAVPLVLDKSIPPQNLKVGEVVEGYGKMIGNQLQVIGNLNRILEAPPTGAPLKMKPKAKRPPSKDTRPPSVPKSERRRVRYRD